MKPDLVVIRNYIDEIPANLAKAALEGSGIDAMIRKDDCGGMKPYMQVGTGIQLLVRQEDAERAEEVLKDAEKSMSDESSENS
ncbi:DUF2007 domain-containing protein [bacterium]|jgi:hypothetical protein|nr:DUF2007 domain-containing protein [bacterium]